MTRIEPDHRKCDMAPKVVIIGGGFGGLSAAQGLDGAPVDVTLVDRRNFHLFQPLLYQVATGALSPANIATPLRSILSHQTNARVLLASATGFDAARRCVLLEDGELEYDYLIVSTGSRHHYFGHDNWEPLAPGLKTVEDALEIRRRLLLAFEAAEREALRDPSSEAVKAWLTFVIVGGGPTGVELAGAIGEIANYTLKHDYRAIRPENARIILIEAVDRVLPTYPPPLPAKAIEALGRLGVQVVTGGTVSDIQPDAVTISRAGTSERIVGKTVLWAAGVQVSPLAEALKAATSAPADRGGRLLIAPDLSLPNHPEIFVIGDLAHVEQDGRPLPGVAPVALQEGSYVARVIRDRIVGKASKPFRYRERGNMATIGRSAAVADLNLAGPTHLHLSGLIGWVTWLTLHLVWLARFENRLLVLVQWAWNYFTRGRSARLITDPKEWPREP
jgi:NADH dehydrogenase